MTACRCPDPRVFGHQLNGCQRTAVPVAGYTPGQVCDYDCPHHTDPVEKLAVARIAALNHLERAARRDAQWARMEAS